MPLAVRLTGLARRFGKVAALDGVSLEVEEGTIYGFLGRNGAGKSTTLKVLLGVIRPDAGQVELFGQPVKKVTPELKQQIGYLAQEQRFYAWMKPKQLAAFVAPFYPAWSEPEFDRLLEVLDVPKDRRSGDMSGGNRTKLALAMALAARPRLLLLDEPTAGLDPVVRREFLDQLAREVRTRGVTVLYSSHLVDEVEALAQRVGIIEAGKMRFEGSPDLLRRTVRRVRPLPPQISGLEVPVAPAVDVLPATSAPVSGFALPSPPPVVAPAVGASSQLPGVAPPAVGASPGFALPSPRPVAPPGSGFVLPSVPAAAMQVPPPNPLPPPVPALPPAPAAPSPIPAPRPSAPSVPPPLPGLTPLVDNAYRATPEAWAAFASVPGFEVEELDLEEIFLAVARAR